MTVAELIQLLQKMPQDAVVVRQGDEYKDDERYLVEVKHRPQLVLGMLCAPSVILR
jgi:hypothetical protein